MLPHFYDAMAPSLAEEDLNANFTREAGSFENIAVNSILRGSQWTETFKAPAPPSQHINVKEARALTTAVSRECTQLLGGKPGGSRRRDRRCRQDDPLVAQARRQLYLSDSSVVRGAFRKGRSRSLALNRELWPAVAAVVGADHYPGVDTAPTRLNVSDDPTRGKSVRQPTSESVVTWADEAFGQLAALPRQKRATAEWARIVYLAVPDPSWFGCLRSAWPRADECVPQLRSC